jgi:hypothetical protein
MTLGYKRFEELVKKDVKDYALLQAALILDMKDEEAKYKVPVKTRLKQNKDGKWS